MIPIYRMALIQIDVTNACHLRCANCTRFVGHHRKPFYMDLETVEKALKSLEGFPGGVGLMGGEPTIHPQFVEICELFRKYIKDKSKRGFWTAGYKWDEYKKIICETFSEDKIIYNDHSAEEGVHQPLLLAAEDILEDRELMWRLIGSCWVQWRWSASVNHKGAFFCEVAAALDTLFEGPGGYPLEKGWWNKNAEQFSDQVKRYCPMCSAAIPMRRPSSHESKDLVSKSNAERLKKLCSPKFLSGKCCVLDTKFTEDDVEKAISEGWTPWSHRPFKQSSPNHRWVDVSTCSNKKCNSCSEE